MNCGSGAVLPLSRLRGRGPGGGGRVRDAGPKGRDPAGQFPPGLDSVANGSIVCYGAAARPRRSRGHARNPQFNKPFYPPISVAMIAFCAWSRFSASSNTRERGPSITPSVTSSPRCAGRQCRKMERSVVDSIIDSSTQ